MSIDKWIFIWYNKDERLESQVPTSRYPKPLKTDLQTHRKVTKFVSKCQISEGIYMKKIAQMSLFMQILTPIIKWQGGKQRAMPELLKFLPSNIGNFYDLFAGGLGFTLGLFNAGKLQHGIHINDLNPKLVNLYIQIRDNPEQFIDLLQELKDDWNSYDEILKKQRYYQIRKEFNDIESDSDLDVYNASHFVFLNKLTYNGCYRVNSKGEFNLPIGKNSNKEYNQFTFDADNILQLSAFLKQCTITCKDYRQIKPQEGDFVYFDPPYYPVKDDSFTGYTKEDFKVKDQMDLYMYAHDLRDAGVDFMMSNSDCEEVRELYYMWTTIREIQRNNTVSSDVKNRGKVSELVITSYDFE